ncbi:hypothetical protein, partial [Mesorhizobium sp. BHbdii]
MSASQIVSDISGFFQKARLQRAEPSGRSITVVFDHHGTAVMVLVDRTRNNDGIGAMVPAAVIV